MPNFKITQLPSASQIEDLDIFPLVDISETETKYSSVALLKSHLVSTITELPSLIVNPSTNFINFTSSVRTQFTAGTGINITDGIITNTSLSTLESILGSTNIDVANGTGPNATVSLKNTITGLTSVSSTGFTGSFSGNGSQLTDLSASQITNFSLDVRAQFSAGSNITISPLGVISSTGGGGGGGGDITAVFAGTNLTGGGSSGDVTIGLNSTLTGLTSVSSTQFVGGGASITNLNAGNISTGVLPVARGGTGLSNLSGAGGNGVLVGNGSGLATTLVGTVDGQVLKWNNTTKNWAAGTDNSNVGTVTSIATNDGITGGTITGAGTIGLTGSALQLHNLNTFGLIARGSDSVIRTRTLVGAGGITVSDNGTGTGAITINNTTPGIAYIAGGGITIAGTTISNSGVISLTSGGTLASNLTFTPSTGVVNATLSTNPLFRSIRAIKDNAGDTDQIANTFIAYFSSSIAQTPLTVEASPAVTVPAAIIRNLGSGNSLVVEDAASDTSKFIIDNDGNVGIGANTTVGAKLDITHAGTTSALRITNTGTGNCFEVLDAASDTTKFVIDSDGRIAIGKNSTVVGGPIIDITGNPPIGQPLLKIQSSTNVALQVDGLTVLAGNVSLGNTAVNTVQFESSNVFIPNNLNFGTFSSIDFSGGAALLSLNLSTFKVGINTTITPSSAFEVSGAMANHIAYCVAGQTLNDSATNWIIEVGGTTTLNLPDCTTCPGRIYNIKNFSGKNITLASPNGFNNGAAAPVMAANSSQRLFATYKHSTGTSPYGWVTF